MLSKILHYYFLVVSIAFFFFLVLLLMLNSYCFSIIHNDELTSKKHCKNNYELYYVDEVVLEGLCHLVHIELSELLDVQLV